MAVSRPLPCLGPPHFHRPQPVPGAVPALSTPQVDIARGRLYPPLHDMPRTTHPASAGLRNRNRVTNKTRLKVIRDTIEADSIVLDEDEEKARVVSTAGVDAEDANVRLSPPVSSPSASMLERGVWPRLIGWNRGNFVPRNADSSLSLAYLGAPSASSLVRSGVSASSHPCCPCGRQGACRARRIHPDS